MGEETQQHTPNMVSRSMMAMQPQTKHMTRRKPGLVFKSEMDRTASGGPRCLWNRDNLNHWPRCRKCQSSYHAKCVALSSMDQMRKPFFCPLCSLKAGKSYEPAEVRVTYHDDDPEENAKFMDVKACLENYSWKVIRHALPPPAGPTITVELFLLIPGTNPNVE